MPSRHLTIGTAGHIDHGKTALIRALTGIECDTHAEEKSRGITIHLGFAHIDLADGTRVGIVDVPGHAAFIRTMVSGASGIDFALFVVAADEGVMPQTREHLEIMQVLGVRSGILVLNKTDLVDDEVLGMARDELRGLVKGTFLEDAPLVEVSSKTGAGIDTLKSAIAESVAAAQDRPRGEVFRMFVDRIFTVKGFGTVVTGSVLSGKLHTGDEAFLLPRGTALRVRRLEQFNEETPEVVAGDRASLNLVGLSQSDFSRGMLIADRQLRSTQLLDVQVRLFSHSRELGLWSQVDFHLGTYEAQARMHLIDRDRLSGAQNGLAQIHLPSPCVVQAGDRFVLRSSSFDLTLGGGEVIDAFPLHHRKRRHSVVEAMETLAAGDRGGLIAAEVRKRMTPIRSTTLGDILNLSEREVRETALGGLGSDIAIYETEGRMVFHRRDISDLWREQIVKAIAAVHRRNPLEKRGLRMREAAGAAGAPIEEDSETVIAAVLNMLTAEGVLKAVDDTYAMKSHSVTITPQLQSRIYFISGWLERHGMKAPLYSELTDVSTGQGMDEKEVQRILRYLVASKHAYHIEDTWLHASIVDSCRGKLVDELKRRGGKGITVAEFRDLVDGNRRICLLLLAQYDNEDTTRREGDLRFLIS